MTGKVLARVVVSMRSPVKVVTPAFHTTTVHGINLSVTLTTILKDRKEYGLHDM